MLECILITPWSLGGTSRRAGGFAPRSSQSEGCGLTGFLPHRAKACDPQLPIDGRERRSKSALPWHDWPAGVSLVFCRSILHQRFVDSIKDQPWAGRPFNIIVNDRCADLWGFVCSVDEKTAVRVAAEATPEIESVSDHLGIAPQTSGTIPWVHFENWRSVTRIGPFVVDQRAYGVFSVRSVAKGGSGVGHPTISTFMRPQAPTSHPRDGIQPLKLHTTALRRARRRARVAPRIDGGGNYPSPRTSSCSCSATSRSTASLSQSSAIESQA